MSSKSIVPNASNSGIEGIKHQNIKQVQHQAKKEVYSSETTL